MNAVPTPPLTRGLRLARSGSLTPSFPIPPPLTRARHLPQPCHPAQNPIPLLHKIPLVTRPQIDYPVPGGKGFAPSPHCTLPTAYSLHPCLALEASPATIPPLTVRADGIRPNPTLLSSRAKLKRSDASAGSRINLDANQSSPPVIHAAPHPSHRSRRRLGAAPTPATLARGL